MFFKNLYILVLWTKVASGLKNRSVIDTKESDGIDDPMEKITIKFHSDHSDSEIGKILILIDAYFVILLQWNKMTN